ncbi:MAG: 16S rRNA (cytosine(1402)-N(4))-methyltransferase RsmH [Bacteroidia bacterium]
MSNYHVPVLLQECIEGLKINPNGRYVDVTFGGGGHSREIIKHLRNGELFGFDKDEDAKHNALADERFTLIPESFSNLKKMLKLYNAVPVDGILADLGVSSHQFDVPERGFSIRFNAKLDMRMNRNFGKTAADVLNSYDELQLKQMFLEYGELFNAGKIASKIIQARGIEKIETVNHLKDLLAPLAFKPKEHQFFAKVFQALRMEVNDEVNELKLMLQQSLEVLKKGGRLVVISYHSIEDRLVKNFMKSGNFEGVVEKDFYGNAKVPFKVITTKPILPTDEEVQKNNRARSAKLRIAEKIID